MTEDKSETEKKAVYNRMESLMKRARAGEDFAKLAEAYSEDPGSNRNGGLYKNIGRGEMVKPFDDAAFSVPVGNVSNIVETRYGYHILKVEDRGGETRSFEEMREELHITALIEKKNNAYENHLQKVRSS